MKLAVAWAHANLLYRKLRAPVLYCSEPSMKAVIKTMSRKSCMVYWVIPTQSTLFDSLILSCWFLSSSWPHLTVASTHRCGFSELCIYMFHRVLQVYCIIIAQLTVPSIWLCIELVRHSTVGYFNCKLSFCVEFFDNICGILYCCSFSEVCVLK